MRKLFGEQLLGERKKKKLTAEELSKACGVSRSYITLIESGKRLPGTKVIPRIASALDIKTGTVLNWCLEEMSQKMRKDLNIS